MFLDAVLDENIKPVFNAQPHEVVQWLKDNPVPDDYQVCVGKTLEFLSVRAYLDRDEKANAAFSE